MKVWIIIPFVLVIGFMLGSWGPKSELSDLRKENKSLRKAIKNKESSQTRRISGITQLLGIDEQNKKGGTAATSAETQASGTNALSSNSVDSIAEQKIIGAEKVKNSEELVQPDAKQSETNSPPKQDDFKKRMEKAAELWAVRVDISRSVFISNEGLSDEEIENFDMHVDNMNLLIGQKIANFAEDAKDAEMIQSEAGIRLANDIMTSVVDTYDAIDADMPQGWRRRAGKEFALTDFIDPLVAMPLGKVENKLPDGQLE